MDFLERLAEVFVEALLPGFSHARKRVRTPPPPSAAPPPPDAPEPPFDAQAAVLQFIWDTTPQMRQNFGQSFPRFQQAYAQGWVRWQFDGLRLHVWVGPPDGQRHDRTSPGATMENLNPVAAALKALGFKTGKLLPVPTPEEIRQAFRTLAPRCHPDRFPGDARKLARYKKLTAAYAVLKGAKLA